MRLFERESQRGALAEYAREANTGQGRLVLIAGEAGVGKSSLLDDLEQSLGPAAIWCWGACDGLFTPRPLAPLFDLAGQLGGEVEQLCRTAGSRDELFAALLRQANAPDHLTVLAVEDVHWADEATLDLLRFLGRRIRTSRTLLLVTYRDDGLAPDDALRVALGSLATQRTTRRVNLPPLTAQAVTELVGGTGLEPAEVFQLTGGNPFFLGEILEHGLTELPASARDAVLARVAGLSEAARDVLDLAALLGGRVEPNLIQALVPTSPATFDELLATSVLVADGETLRFRHELARLAVEQSVGLGRRGLIHTRILHVLRSTGCGDDARLAFHAEGAGDVLAVLEHAARAGRVAAELGAHREAIVQYGRALRFSTGADDRTVAVLHDALAREASFVDRWQEANEAGEAALLLWQRAGDQLREGASLSMLARTRWRVGRGRDAHQAAEQARTVLEPLGPSAELAAAYADLAATRASSCELAEAFELTDRAIELAERLGLPSVLSDALNTRGGAAAELGGDWEGPLAKALAVAQTHLLHDKAGRAYLNVYTLFGRDLRFDDGERFFVAGVAHCDEHDITTYGRCLRGERATQLERLGRWDEALALGQQLVANAGASTVNRMIPLVTVGRLRARRGLPDAWDCLEQATAAAEGLDEALWIAVVRTARIEARWLTGDRAAAVEEAWAAWALAARCDVIARSQLFAWLHLLGQGLPADFEPVQPYASQVAGRCSQAAAVWDAAGCGYEAALALAAGPDESDLRAALGRFDALGAVAAARVVRRTMRERGIRSIPAGAQPATREHPAGLTPRESEVLALLCEARTDDEIAGQLFISVKTVGHHVSAVLAKLGVPSRKVAAAEAVRLGLVGAPR